MDKIKFYLEKYKLYIGIFITIVFLLIILFFLLFNKEEVANAKEIIVEEKKEEKVEIEKIRVDVKGYVEKEGVYELDSNSRVIDQTTPNMIQKLNLLFARKPLISKEI